MTTQPTSSPPAITSLSSELKVLILRQMPDVASLKAIVRASSQYHQVYLSMRERILTGVVLRMLDARSLDLTIPYKYKAWAGNTQKPNRIIEHAAQTLRRQARSNQPVRLNVEQCLALLKLTKARVSYGVVTVSDGRLSRCDGRSEIRSSSLGTFAKAETDCGSNFCELS